MPTLFGHREVSSAREYRRILRRQTRRIQNAVEDARINEAHRRALRETSSGRYALEQPRPGFLKNTFDKTLESTVGPVAALGGEIGFNTGRALVESGDVRRETLKGLKDLPAGIVMGAVGAVTQPGKTASGLVDQYKRTYGPALEGDWGEFRRRMGEKHSGGAVQVLADGSIIIGGAGVVAGRAARAGMLGSKARAVMTADRPRLRYSGGREGALEQEVPSSLFAARRARRRDRSRVRTYERRYAAAGNEDFAPTLRPVSRPKRDRHGNIVGGEVVARGGLEVRIGRSGRAVVVPAGPERFRTAQRLGRKQAAREKGQRRIVQLEEQHALGRVYANTVGLRVGKRFGNLTRSQQKAFRYVYGGLVHAGDPVSAVRHLRERREQILEHRMELSAKGKRRSLPGPRRQFNEELRVIDDLIDGLERGDPVLTETLAGAANRMRKVEIAIARGRPDLTDVPIPGQVGPTTLRRYAPQAEFLARMDMRARARGEAHDAMLPAMKADEHPYTYISRVGLRRVVERAKSEGMLRPGYFPSERRFTRRFSDNAIGGSRGLVDDRTYRGELFRRGEEDVRPEVLLAGLMRGVKRRHNMNLLAEQFAKHAIDLGPAMREISAARRRGAREEARQREVALSKFLQMNELTGQRRALDDQFRTMAISVEPSPAFWEELDNARVQFDNAISDAKEAGDLARWSAMRKEKAQLEEEYRREVDRHVRITAQRERTRAQLDALDGEIEDLRASVAPESRSWFDKVGQAEADLRAAHEGLFHARRLAPEYVDDAVRIVDESEQAYAKALEGARENVGEVAGGRARQAAMMRLARDSMPGAGRTIKEIVDDLERARINPEEVMFFNPGRIYASFERGANDEGTPLNMESERFGFDSIDGAENDRGLLEAFNGNVLRGDVASRRVRSNPDEFQKVDGWVAVPRAVGEEIMSAARPDFLMSRLWDVGKGKFSRVLLGLGNVSWLAFQIGSNAFLSGLFGKVGPLDMYRAQKWWNDLSADEQASLMPILGQSAHHMDFDRRYLGSTAANSTIVNAKRAMEKSAFWQAARKGNPIDLMFRLDAHQNLFFRRALLYSEAKRRAMQRMGESTHDIVNLNDKIETILTKRGDRLVNDYLSDKATLELHGRKVDELLGDYLTYTSLERRTLQRFVMFYGFVRHSLRLTLWTLPTKHPIMTGILGKLALLGQEEAEELLGGQQLPWGLGKFYFTADSGLASGLDALPLIDIDTDAVDPETGEPALLEVDLARMSPATNAFLEIRQAAQIGRVFPPMLSILIEHIAEENLNTGRKWQVRGLTRDFLAKTSPNGSPYGWLDHLKVLAGDLSATIPPVRYAERVLFTGPQGEDASLVFGPAETGYRDPGIRKSIEESRRRTESRSAGQRLGEVIFPMLPRPSEDPRIVKGRRERQAEADELIRKHNEDEGDRTPLERFRRSQESSPKSNADRLRRFRESLKGGG